MKKYYAIFLISGVMLTVGGAKSEAAEPLPDTDTPHVSALWLEFAEAQRTGAPCTLLDFSYAGYRHGEEGVPDVNHKVFNVLDFGAVANDGKSDRTALEAAVAAAVRHGSGIIFFPRGRYDLHAQGDPDKPILVQGSHIVFRGEGSGPGGTELFMEYPNQPVNPQQMWTSPDLLVFKPAGGSRAKLTDVTSDAPRSSFSVEVASAAGIKAGDWVCLTLKNNDPALIAEELHPYEVEPGWTDLTENGVQVIDYHLVTAVKGRTIVFKEPIMRAVDKKWGWTIRKFPRLEEVGVEDIAFVGNWKEPFVHHKNWLHDGGYKMVSFSETVNSWVRRCRFTDVSECSSIIWSANFSYYDCVIDGNIGHSAMRSAASSRVFFGKIDDQPAQWHSVGVSKPSIGAVIWRGSTNANSCFESHASQPRATLFDVCRSGFMRGRGGGAKSNNPNHLADLTLWNFEQTSPAQEDFDFWATDTHYWRFMPPIFSGFHSADGTCTTFVQSQVVADESHGTPVKPESLYEAQLQLRLGSLPQWIIDLKINQPNLKTL